jgi:16S rRNA (cytosine1402-N4)-methyltransferase
MSSYHRSVLLDECINALNINPDGIYIDCTFGGGGHSREILNKLSDKGRLIAFDQDDDAFKNIIVDPRFLLIHQNFKYLDKYLRIEGIDKVDGILADLGVSSHQLDQPERGFSYRFDTPLDMRMDTRDGITAAEILNEYSEEALKIIFEKFGEVRNAKSLAKAIVNQRNKNLIKTVNDFNQILEPLSFGALYAYASPVYQALRIEVNRELEVLEHFLNLIPLVLKSSGRIAIISFHSLEDRMVKNYFKEGVVYGEAKKDIYGKSDKPLKLITKKPIEADEIEVKINARSRSAKLRVAEKL